MGEVTANRVSALAGKYAVGRHGAAGSTGVRFSEAQDLVLWQVAAWPDTIDSVAARLAEATVSSSPTGGSVPGFGQSAFTDSTALLRTEPLKFWVIGEQPPAYDANDAVSVDLSHSRTLIRLQGAHATTVLNGYLPLDLREDAFPIGSVASTAFHHCGVTLWRSPDHYELFLPRGFGMSLWELLLEGALQYGCEVG